MNAYWRNWLYGEATSHSQSMEVGNTIGSRVNILLVPSTTASKI